MNVCIVLKIWFRLEIKSPKKKKMNFSEEKEEGKGFRRIKSRGRKRLERGEMIMKMRKCKLLGARFSFFFFLPLFIRVSILASPNRL